MCQSVAMSEGSGSNTSGALLVLGCGSCAKSRTLMPAACSARMRSSGVGSVYSRTSRAISVGAGELSSDDVCVGSGVVSIGARVKMCRFLAGAAAGQSADGDGTEAEAESAGGVIGVGRITGSDVSTWRRFPSREGVITAGEDAVAVRGALVASNITTSCSAGECDETRPNVLSRRRNGMVDMSLW